jgi:RNAse (barnase) inhibitor barstar
MARRLGTAADERSVHAVELLDVSENEKVLRALEHLAVRDELSPGLVSLWDGLTRDVRAVPVSYRLELAHFEAARNVGT